MKKAAAAVLPVDLRFSENKPLHRQFYLAVKAAILEGRMRPGDRLPSTRALAGDFGVSRTTVLNAFDQLSAEGYLEAKVGSGTHVASYIPGDLAKQPKRGNAGRVLSWRPEVARRAHLPPFSDLSFLHPPARPLRPGQPEPSLFPQEIWARLAAKHWRQANRDPEHFDSLGYRPLRQAICDYVARLRAVRCQPDQILITCGAQQGLYLAACTLLDPGDSVCMEDPGYPRARAAFCSAGLKILPLPVDSEGMVVPALRRGEIYPRLVYVTPSFHCPLGITMSLVRRFALLQMAKHQNAWIVEDDYFSEYHYGTAPIASLQSIDRGGCVIYIGNFSKSVAPNLRIGYLILPSPLVDAFREVRSTMSRQPSGVDQAILAEFIMQGHLERQIRTTLRVYRERQHALTEAIKEHGIGLLEASPAGTGMYLTAWLRPGIDDRAAARRAADHGIDTIPLSTFCIEPARRKALVLGYSAFEPDRIRLAVKQLCAALSETN